MKMQEAMDIINEEPSGYMVHFEWWEGGFLTGRYFPDKHAGDPLIDTEDEAWTLAKKFARSTKNRAVNIYVIDSKFFPVAGYRPKIIKNR